MTLVILAGVWALVFGHITLTERIKMKGNQARLFGALAILAAHHVFPHISGYLAGVAPKFITGNETYASAYGLIAGAFTLWLTAWVCTNVLHKVRIPMVSVKMKRARA